MLKWKESENLLVAERTTMHILRPTTKAPVHSLMVEGADGEEHHLHSGTLLECKYVAELYYEEHLASTPGDVDPRPSRTVCTAIEFLAHVIEQDHGLKGGKTAFYWDLFYSIQRHLKLKEST
jgi:hypothetical protein